MFSIMSSMHLSALNFLFGAGSSYEKYDRDLNTNAGDKGNKGIFDTFQTGAKNLHGKFLPYFADFCGVCALIVGVWFTLKAVGTSREKGKAWLAAAIAYGVGAILLTTGAIFHIQDSFGNSWQEVFSAFVNLHMMIH